MKRRARLPLVALTCMSSTVLNTLSASATFPGANGEIVYAGAGTLRALDPDATNDRAFTSLSHRGDVAFSSDGTHSKLDPSLDKLDLWTMNRRRVERAATDQHAGAGRELAGVAADLITAESGGADLGA